MVHIIIHNVIKTDPNTYVKHKTKFIGSTSILLEYSMGEILVAGKFGEKPTKPPLVK